MLYTLVDPELRDLVRDHCRRLQLPCVGVLDQAMSVLAVHFHSKSEQWPGRQHQLDEGYFDRIDAMHYTLAHDDGQSTHDLEDADVILVGPSRNSKTPTCVYLANRGVRAANVPLVPLVDPPSALENAKRPLIVGLITDPQQAEEIVAAGKADLVALARGMLFDPRWPWHAAAQLGARVSAPPQYWRAPPHGHKDLFAETSFGAR